MFEQKLKFLIAPKIYFTINSILKGPLTKGGLLSIVSGIFLNTPAVIYSKISPGKVKETHLLEKILQGFFRRFFQKFLQKLEIWNFSNDYSSDFSRDSFNIISTVILPWISPRNYPENPPKMLPRIPSAINPRFFFQILPGIPLRKPLHGFLLRFFQENSLRGFLQKLFRGFFQGIQGFPRVSF